jgi:peptide/nickel transport system substrate-binding protein
MKTTLVTLLAGVGFLAMILLMGYQPVVAAPPTGEVKIIAPSFGNAVGIPFLERGHALDWMDLFYDSLVGCTPEGKLSPDLGLANKWEMSPDGLTWTFYLRKGVKFHDGVEVTARDVKFNIDQLITRRDAIVPEAAFLRKNAKNIGVKDPYTVVIQCNQPDLFLPQLFSNMDCWHDRTEGLLREGGRRWVRQTPHG